MLFDLHVHSIYSDGNNEVEYLIKEAKRRNFDFLSITDHDTILSQKPAVMFSDKFDLKYITGVEINAQFPTMMDILGYNIDINNHELNEALETINKKRIERNVLMVDLLKKDFDISYHEICEYAGDQIIGRPHIAKAMIKKGYGTTISEIIEKYLTRGKKYFLERFKYSSKETINLIKRSGGMAVLAHPIKLGLSYNQMELLIEELVEYGLDGLEIFHYTCKPEYSLFLYRLAEKFNLITTGGSDYHGFSKPYVSYGLYLEEFFIEKFKRNLMIC